MTSHIIAALMPWQSVPATEVTTGTDLVQVGGNFCRFSWQMQREQTLCTFSQTFLQTSNMCTSRKCSARQSEWDWLPQVQHSQWLVSGCWQSAQGLKPPGGRVPFSSFAASSPLHASYNHAKTTGCDSPLAAAWAACTLSSRNNC